MNLGEEKPKTEAGPYISPGLVSQTLLQLISPFSFLIDPWLVSNSFFFNSPTWFFIPCTWEKEGDPIQAMGYNTWPYCFPSSEDWNYTRARATILVEKGEDEWEVSHEGARSKGLLRRRKSWPSRGCVYMGYMQCRCVQPVGMFCSHIWTKPRETWFSENSTCCTRMMVRVQIPRTHTERWVCHWMLIIQDWQVEAGNPAAC